MNKEPTASAFIVRPVDDGTWQTALVWHPRLHCWLPAGGHVEPWETPAEAAIRECREETGLHVSLLHGPAAPVPDGYPHQPVPAPWWVSELPAAPDSHTATPHVHIDHLYLATADSDVPDSTPGHHVRWFTAAETAEADGIAPDSRIQAAALFGWLSAHGHRTPPAPRTCDAPQLTAEVPELIVIRGNSAAGKSTIAAAIRAWHATRDLAIVSQDTLRRDLLRERDIPGGANITLIDHTARHALGHGFHVIIEGILRADHYGEMLTRLITDHAERAHPYYLDIPWPETLKRHATKPVAAKYGAAEMRAWWRERDLLPGGIEHVITAESTLEQTVTRIMADAGLSQHAPAGQGADREARSAAPATLA